MFLQTTIFGEIYSHFVCNALAILAGKKVQCYEKPFLMMKAANESLKRVNHWDLPTCQTGKHLSESENSLLPVTVKNTLQYSEFVLVSGAKADQKYKVKKKKK